MDVYHSRGSPDRPNESTCSNRSDSTTKSLVCDACWSGIFSTDAWEAVLAAKPIPDQTGSSNGFTYKTTWATIQTAADRDGCNWCRLLARPELAATRGDLEVVIRAACDEYSDCTPAGEKKLAVEGHGGGAFWEQYYMYTSPGTYTGRYALRAH